MQQHKEYYSFLLARQVNTQTLLSLAKHLTGAISGTTFLYSGGSLDAAERSYLCICPTEHVTLWNRRWERADAAGELRWGDAVNPWLVLKRFLTMSGSPCPEWVGYLGYGMGASADPLQPRPYRQASTPDAHFKRYAIVAEVESQTGKVVIHVMGPPPTDPQDSLSSWHQQLSTEKGWSDLIEGLPLWKVPGKIQHQLRISSPFDDRETYSEKVCAAKELIAAGDIYQVCLSHQMQLEGTCDAYGLFEMLAHDNPAPFMAYQHHPEAGEGFHLVSSSPERFLSKRGNRLETRPIKGTAPRGETPQADEQLRQQLLTSEKNKAELLMITDLMRNDLGKISKIGSVVTDELWRCEGYANVFHLVSVIHAEANDDMHPVDLVRACFPAGSISGCPKLSAMKVIDDIENRARGLFTGAVGYFSGNEDFDFNVAIRTMTVNDDSLDIQVGGAVVTDSEPSLEYEETLHKGSSIFKALGIFKNSTVYS